MQSLDHVTCLITIRPGREGAISSGCACDGRFVSSDQICCFFFSTGTSSKRLTFSARVAGRSTGAAGKTAFLPSDTTSCCVQRSVTIAMQTPIPPTVSALISTVALLLCLALLLMLCVLKKKRRMEGTYRPSAEERKQIGGTRSDKSGLSLPLPKEERLI
ncbi:protein crumbs homolog 3b [Nerophis lumbriciformis]|uniref:protein crumbs homolog 3b n=1 Tax=Nerophis lumbriciformis TaxID=546530 RepID=UPI003BA9DE39